MVKRWITERQIEKYRLYLQNEEKSAATIEKYIRDVRKFNTFLCGNCISRKQVLMFKQHLIGHYKAASVNSMIAAINSFFGWQGGEKYKVKPLKIQRQIFRPQEEELTKKEYQALLKAAKAVNNEQMNLIMQTICGTGIRISELSYITAEAMKKGVLQVHCKNKTRYIWMPAALRQQLKTYMKKKRILSGAVFITSSGKPVSRGFVWRQMKKTAALAGIDAGKVYPHNLRHLFARSFYEMNKDIIKLSDILGHSCVETTRIYTMTSGRKHAGYIERLGLVTGCT